MRIAARQTQLYPHLLHFLQREIGPRAKRPAVWDALRDLTGLSADRLRLAVQWGYRPLVQVVPICISGGRSMAGAFLHQAPDSILLDRGHVRRFEALYLQESAKLQMEAVVLHEIAHWGWWKTHGHPEPRGREIGQEFEHRAYGHRPSEFVTCSPSPRMQLAERRLDRKFGSPIYVVLDCA